MKSTEQVYRQHHSNRRREGFAVLETERGELFKNLIGTDKAVLDLGCRDGVITKYFTQSNEVTGADIDSEALEHAKANLGIKTVHFDLQDDIWPFQEKQFDVVVIAEVLEHLYFPDKVLAKINRVLKPGGMIIGSVPNAFSLKNKIRYLFNKKRGTPLEDPMHINHFSWAELEGLLAKEFKEAKLIPLGKALYGLKKAIPSAFSYGVAFKATKE